MGPIEAERIREAPAGILTNVEHYRPHFFQDESRMVGRMESISFPRTEDDLRDQLGQMHRIRRPVTVQGTRTGISGGAVPQGGHALTLNRMTRILGMRHDSDCDAFFLILEGGVFLRDQIWRAMVTREFDTTGWSGESLEALEAFKAAPEQLFTPDPSEPTIAIGGMVANNASGARSFRYGPTRPYVERLRVVLVDGGVLELKRGREKTRGRSFSVETDTGRVIEGRLPAYEMPKVKNSAGYFVRDDMDLLDLFVGSEGTLGVFSEIEVRLVPAPPAMTGAMVFLPTDDDAIGFAKDVRASKAAPAVIEFFDCRSIRMLRDHEHMRETFFSRCEIPAGSPAAVYLEYHGGDTDSVDWAVRDMAEILAAHGGYTDLVWTGSSPEDIANFKQIKHIHPELINGLVAEQQQTDPRIHKLGTDLAVPDDRHDDLMALYRAGLDGGGFDYQIFGHLGDSNLHVNIIPRGFEEYEAGRRLQFEWARAAVEMGGTVSAEHGIGKIKKPLLKEMYRPQDVEQMVEVKRCFDPDFLLSPGNIFDAPSAT